MLDQPVPNPVAKNPNIYTHKVFASVGLILIGTIIILSILAYFYPDQLAFLYSRINWTNNDVVFNKVSTSSAKTATSSASNIKVKDGYASNKTFSIKIPNKFSLGADRDQESNGVTLYSDDYKMKPFSEYSSVIASGTSIRVNCQDKMAGDTLESLADSKDFPPSNVSYTTVGGYKAVKSTNNAAQFIGGKELTIITITDKYACWFLQDYKESIENFDSSDLDSVAASFKFL